MARHGSADRIRRSGLITSGRRVLLWRGSKRGEVSEWRADAACLDRDCGHRRCWISEAQVTELTAILRGGRRDQLATWPKAIRIFAAGNARTPAPNSRSSRPEEHAQVRVGTLVRAAGKVLRGHQHDDG